MPFSADTANASCEDILKSCQSAEDAINLVRGAMSLKTTLKDELALQFVNMIHKIGFSQFKQLIESHDLEETYRRIHAPSQISPRHSPAIAEDVNNTLSDSGPNNSGAPALDGTGDLCGCPPRKAPYKTVRGLREHLMIKHGVSQADAEAEAQGVLTRLQAGSQTHVQHGSHSFSPAQDYGLEEWDWDAQYEEYQLNGIVDEQVALPNRDMRS